MLNFKGIAVINEGVLDLRQWPAEQIDVQRAFQGGVDTDERVIFWGPKVRLLVTAQQASWLFQRLQGALEMGVDTLAGGFPDPGAPSMAGPPAPLDPSYGQVGIPTSSIPRNVANTIAAKANLTVGEATNLRNYLNGVITQAQRRQHATANQQVGQQEMAGVS
jgi:hypothetical protein